MARKLEKPEADNDLEILHPERQLTLQGQVVTVREYGFVESLRLRPSMQPFLVSLYELVDSGSSLSLDQVMDVIGRHWDNVLAMVEVAADIDRDFIDSLSSAEGELLLMAWWGANGPFFSRQLQTRLLSHSVQRRAPISPASGGATSTPSSLPQDMTPGESEITPSGN